MATGCISPARKLAEDLYVFVKEHDGRATFSELRARFGGGNLVTYLSAAGGPILLVGVSPVFLNALTMMMGVGFLGVKNSLDGVHVYEMYGVF